MAKNQKIRVSTLEALAASVVAFRKFNQSIIRDLPDNNKSTIVAHFTKEHVLDITDSDYTQAQEILSGLSQRVMMLGLTNAYASPFLIDINQICQQDEVSSEKFGLIAWAPKLYADIVKSDNVRETILALAPNSVHIGKEGHRVSFEYTPISCQYLKNYDSWVNYGHDEKGNIVYFWRRDQFNRKCMVTARVKEHRKDSRYSNATVTALNYVKEIGK